MGAPLHSRQAAPPIGSGSVSGFGGAFNRSMQHHLVERFETRFSAPASPDAANATSSQFAFSSRPPSQACAYLSPTSPAHSPAPLAPSAPNIGALQFALRHHPPQARPIRLRAASDAAQPTAPQAASANPRAYPP